MGAELVIEWTLQNVVVRLSPDIKGQNMPLKSWCHPVFEIYRSGVVPARKRSMETMPGDFGWMLVGSTEPLFDGLVPLVVVAPWRNLAGSVLPLPTPPEEDNVVFPWKTDGPLQEQRSVLRILLPARRSLWAVSSFVWGVVPIASPPIDLDWACV